MRIKILRVIVIILFLFVALELIYVQAVRGRYYFKLSKNNRIRVVPLEGERGRIFDRNGKILADNDASYNLMITPQDVGNKEELFLFLEKILGTDARRLWNVYLANRTAPFVPVVIFKDLSREKAIILEENKYRFPSMIVQQSFKRIYPLNKNSAHLLGYVTKMNRLQIERFKEYGYSPESMMGSTGIEEFYDYYLRGEEGGLQIEVNSRGQQMRLLSFRESTKGQDVTLTIDSDLQHEALALLADRPGAIVAMDIKNGEMMCLTSSPAYDPNAFIENVTARVSAMFSNPLAPLLDRTIKAAYPPGSVFKVPVAVAALDSQKINEHTTFFCPGFFELGKTRFGCVHEHGTQNLIEAIAHSCNVYFFHVGLALKAPTIEQYARLLGLGSKTRIDLPYEKEGKIPSPSQNFLAGKRWFAGDTLNMVIGQGNVLTTPLQLVRMMATVARDGALVQPHLIAAIGNRAFDGYFYEHQINISKEFFHIVQKGLRTAVTDDAGTAHILDRNDLFVAGKTGTAQSSAGKEDHAWFVGYAQGDHRTIAFCIFLEHGGSSHNACLMASQFLSFMKNKQIL